MTSLIVLAIGCVLAALLAIAPETAPPYAWWGVLACFVSVPFLFWLEASIATFSKDFDDITGHASLGAFDHNDYH